MKYNDNIYYLELNNDSSLLLNYYNKFDYNNDFFLKLKNIKTTLKAKKLKKTRTCKIKKSYKITNSNTYYNLQKNIYNSLESLYMNIKKETNNYDFTNNRKYYDVNTSKYKEIINLLYDNHFNNNKYISEEIKKFINFDTQKINNNSYILSYKLPYKNKYLTINFVNYNKFTNKHIKLFDKKIIHMLIIINLISQFTDSSKTLCSNNGLSITILMTPFKREITKNTKIIGENNANGGFCYGCINHGEIIVYRKEEWFKVFCHELIHNFGVDSYIWTFSNLLNNQKNNDAMQIYKKFINYFNLNREINENYVNIGLQECIVEFWGEYFNNVIYSYNYSISCNLSNNDLQFNLFLKTFEKMAKNEIIHSYFQNVKILKFYNMHYRNLLRETKKNKKEIIYNNYRENTHIFSYYILKLYLISNYKSFINSGLTITNNYIIKFNNDSSINNMDKFFKYIINMREKDHVIKNYNVIDNIYTKLIKKNKDSKIIKNFRMSCIQYL